MNGNKPVLSKKRQRAGRIDRMSLLRQNGFPIDQVTQHIPNGGQWAWDDLIDACACAWSARRIREGRSLRFPTDPPRDARGLRMEINA
jgi:predicted RNase H-like nuclease